MEIRSYRRVFDLERRIYRIDRLRLNPGGIPVRGVVYFLAILLAVLAARRLPLLAAVGNLLPWYLGDVALPALSAAVLTMIRVEGRPFHLAATALTRQRMGPRRLAGTRACAAIGTRWHPTELVLLPDGSDSRMRRMRYTGPGAVLVAVEHEREGWATTSRSLAIGPTTRRAAVTLRELSGGQALTRRQVIELAPGARLLVRPESPSQG